MDAIRTAEEERESQNAANRANPLDKELIKTKGLLRAPSARVTRRDSTKRERKDSQSCDKAVDVDQSGSTSSEQTVFISKDESTVLHRKSEELDLSLFPGASNEEVTICLDDNQLSDWSRNENIGTRISEELFTFDKSSAKMLIFPKNVDQELKMVLQSDTEQIGTDAPEITSQASVDNCSATCTIQLPCEPSNVSNDDNDARPFESEKLPLVIDNNCDVISNCVKNECKTESVLVSPSVDNVKGGVLGNSSVDNVKGGVLGNSIVDNVKGSSLGNSVVDNVKISVLDISSVDNVRGRSLGNPVVDNIKDSSPETEGNDSEGSDMTGGESLQTRIERLRDSIQDVVATSKRSKSTDKHSESDSASSIHTVSAENSEPKSPKSDKSHDSGRSRRRSRTSKE